MTLAQLNTLLKAIGYPVAYSHFKSETATPYIVYRVESSANFMADNMVYIKGSNLVIELYTDKKDLVAEQKLETVLDTNEIPYDSSETWIESEELFQKLYEVRL